MNWIQRNLKTIIYISFLVPIISVAIVSISHVTTWFGITNPSSWSLYLSIGIEIAALSALAAISAQMGKKVYFPFAIVTLIQFLGNIYFSYQFIDITSESFIDWVELVDPIVSFMGVESGDMVGHKRFLALFSGGMLPIISLSFLHMLVKFEEEEKKKKEVSLPKGQEINDKSIDELSILAGKEEAKIESEKFVPTEEQLRELENTLKIINENKFKTLVETPEVEKQEKPSDTDNVILEEPEIVQQMEEEPTVKRLTYINRNG
jgi:hypothetical protein